METEDVVPEEAGSGDCICVIVCRDEVCPFGESINYYEKGRVPSFGFWERGEEVHSNVFPTVVWERERL
jgi:hypothetical protein